MYKLLMPATVASLKAAIFYTSLLIEQLSFALFYLNVYKKKYNTTKLIKICSAFPKRRWHSL